MVIARLMALMATSKSTRAKAPKRAAVVRQAPWPVVVQQAPTPVVGNDRNRFVDACHCRPVDRPPIWMMRQAGRCLPEYRKLKETYSFLELVRTPDLATEVTLQPIRRFGFDAAILFSDILVVPEAMGQAYRFRETGGIEMDFKVRTRADVNRLSTDAVTDKLSYATDALKLIKRELSGKTALIGFAGSPWTLANFMLEGGSSKRLTKAMRLFDKDRALFDALMEKLTIGVTKFLQAQIAAGVDAVQIFDTLGSEVPYGEFEAASGKWIREIIAGLDNKVPVIAFAKGVRDWETLFDLGAQVLGIDHAMDLGLVRRALPGDIAVQGNLAPDSLVHLTPFEAEVRTRQTLETMRGRPGYIFNLGHGVPPDASLENIGAVVNTVRNFS
ncbi:MAG TPA: uroporphyrinogen decarboxylase [Candidatus Acidoferrum sp.]|nr:uroporphyrinogen decarboxylase [Candidatus Acidoferrum sp.]